MKRPVCEAPPGITGNISFFLITELEDLSQVDSGKCEVNLINQSSRSMSRANIGSSPLTVFAKNLEIGTYTVSITFDTNPANPPGGPGDYIGNASVMVKPGSNPAREINLQRVIHLLSPDDNQDVQKSTPVFFSDMNFSWEPVHPDATYQVCVSQLGAPSFKSLRTTETNASFALDPGEYIIGIDAYLNNRLIGTLRHMFASNYPSGAKGGALQLRYGFQFKIQPVENILSKCAGILIFPLRVVSSFEGKPVFSFFESLTRKPVAIDYRIEGDRFTLNEVPPGSYQLQVTIDCNGENPPGYAGDLFGQIFFSVPQRNFKQLKIDLMKVIRLLEPEDTNSILPEIQPPSFIRNSKVSGETGKVPFTFRWESLGKDIEYRYLITPAALMGRISENQLTVDVTPNVKYNLMLNAFSGDAPVGRLLTNGNTIREGYLFFPVKPEADDPQGISRPEK